MLILLVTIPTDEEQTTASYGNITELIKAHAEREIRVQALHAHT